ncbi:MAG: hypothetical protein WKF58_14955 [Ilumatobacteraceae bacterium]
MANDDEHLDRSVAERVIALIDATNLADDCTDDDVIELCRSATRERDRRRPHRRRVRVPAVRRARSP